MTGCAMGDRLRPCPENRDLCRLTRHAARILYHTRADRTDGTGVQPAVGLPI